MKVAIVGGGHIAKVHGPIILKQPGAVIVGVADKDIERAKATANELGISSYYYDATKMIEELRPDIVHVLTPPQFHAQISTMAMERGCHIFVEKPMALSMVDAQRMIEVAEQNNVKLCVNHNMIFENVVQRAINLVSMGAIGKVVSVNANYLFDARRYPAILEDGAELCHWTYKMNGGPLQDLMPHPASLVFEYITDMKEMLHIGQNSGVLPEGWQDEIRILIKSDDIIGSIGISLQEKPDTVDLTIKGTDGIIQADLFSDIVIVRKKSVLPRAIARGFSGFQTTYQSLKGSFQNIFKFLSGKIDKSNGVAPLIAKFYESINKNTSVPISVNKSLCVVDLMTRLWPEPLVDTEKKLASIKITRKNQYKSTAFVTGASGFIGTHLIKKLLAEDIKVRALVRPNSIHTGRLKMMDVDIIEGDLTNPDIFDEATKGVKTIFHAGAAMSNSWEEHEQATILATKHLINSAIKNKVERFVHFSTLAVYELLDIQSSIIREDSPFQKNPKQMGPYAYAKIETEKLILEAYKNQNLGVTIVRPGMVIGPLGRVFFPHLGYNLQEKIFMIIGKGDNILPLTYIENTVDGIYKASIIEKAIGQSYNLIDDGAEITVKSYIENFINTTGVDAKIINLPYLLPYSATAVYEVAASFGLLNKGVTSRAQLKWKQAKVKFDNTKAKNELGWEPTVSMADGLNKTFRWYALKYYT